jgi:ribosomal protein S12
MNRHLRCLAIAAAFAAPLIAQAQDQAQTPAQLQAQAQAQAASARAQAARAAQVAKASQRAQQAAQAAQAAAAAAQTRAQATEGRVYAPGPFDSVLVDGAGQVRLVQGDRDEVFVPGDASAQEEVSVRLVGKRIKIDLPGGWKFWDNANTQVEVRVRNLTRLTMSGANDVVAPGPISGDQLTISMAGSGIARFDQLQVGHLNFDISGAGEGQLAGKVDSLHLAVSGKGKITADQLRAGSADVSISGVANAQLWTVNDLNVRISGAGHIEYWGQPNVRKSISGLGSVDSRGDK